MRNKGAATMPEQAEEMIVRNLVDSLSRLHADLERVELWAAALGCFRQPAPEYEPGDRYLLQASGKRARHRAKI